MVRAANAAGTTYNWTGATSTAWATTTNWSPNGNPGSAAGDVVRIGVVSFTGSQPTLSVTPANALGSITLGTVTNATLTISANYSTGLLTIGAGSTVTESGAITVTFTGGITNNGTYTASTGTHTFSTNNQTLTGTISIPSFTESSKVVTNNGTLTVATALSITGGAGNGVTNAATGTINIGGTSSGKITTTAAGNTINYTGASQTVLDIAYYNLTISGSGTKSWALGGNRTIAGNLNISSGTLSITGNQNFTVTGTTSITGEFDQGLTAGKTLTFTGNITINSGGVWNETTAGVYTIKGNLQNNGTTFTASTGVHTFSGASKTISGTSAISIPKATFTGTYTNSGTLSVTTALAGTGGLTNAATGTLNIGGTSVITTLTATAVGNLVNYNASGAQTACKVTTYYNLTLSGSGAKTFATTPTVNGKLSIEGTATVVVTSGVVTYGTNATLQYKTTDTRTATSTEWKTPFVASGGVIIANTAGSVTMNGAKIFNTSVPLTINTGATLITNNYKLTFGGNFVKSGTFTAGSSDIEITGTMASQSIAGFSTTGNVTMSKSSGTATISGTVSGATLTMSGAGTLKLSGANTYTGAVNLNAGNLVFNNLNALAASSVVFNGGTLKTGTTSGYSSATGATLNVTTNSTIALGSGVHSLTFANSSGVSWPTYTTLFVTGWTGTLGGSGTAGKLFAGTTSGGLTSQQLTQVEFKIGSNYYPAAILSTGEVVPSTTVLTFGNLSYPSPDSYTSTSAITPLNPTITGTPTGYSVSPALPDGLSIDPVTGIISGSPTTTTATNTYVVTATDGIHTALFGVVITVHIPATYYAITNGNWNSNTTWSTTSHGSAVGAGIYPVAGDVVNIGESTANGAWTVTVPSGFSAAAATINLGSSVGHNYNLTLADLSSSLAVSGDVTMTRSGTNTITNSLNINDGAVSVGGNFTMTGTDGTARITQIVINSGSLTITGNLTLPASGTASNNVINMSGSAGTLNLGNAFSFTVGTLTPGTTSTFNFNGSVAQTIPIGVSSVVYNNITVNNSNTSGATLGSNAITSARVTGNLSVQSGILNNGSLAITLANNMNFTVAEGATFNLSGTSTMVTVAGTGTKTFGVTSTTNYNGTSTGQTVTNETYGYLILSGSGPKTISAGATIQSDFTVSGTAAATAGAALTIAGNVTLGNGTSFTAGAFTHTVGGNWTNNGATTTMTGSTILFNNASSNQTIGGSAASQSFNNLTVDKDPFKLILGVHVTVGGTLGMTSGNIDASSNTLVLGTSATSGSQGTLTYTSGTNIGCFQRWINATATDIQFPVGTATTTNLAVTNFTNLTNGTLTVCFIASNPGTSGLPITDADASIVDKTFTEGYWTLTAANSLASTNYKLSLTGDGFTSYAENGTERIIRRVNSGSVWTFSGTNAAASGNIANRTALAVFGEFAQGRVNPCSVTATTVTGTNITCFGSSSGSVTISGASGGSGNYEYALNSGSWQSGASFTSLAAGSYIAQIRDQAAPSCVDTVGTQVLTQPAVLNATVSSTNVLCHGASTGTITISNPSGGAGTYEYRLNTGTWQSSGNFTGLAAATYDVQIRDAVNTGCVVHLNSSLAVTQPDALTLSSTPVAVSCFSNGSINITAGGGITPYIYDWADLPGTNNQEDRTGLLASSYYVTVTDANSCTITSGAIVVAPAGSCPGVDVCQSNAAKVFSVTPDPTVTSYTWTIPTANGAVLVSGQNTPSIVVDWRLVPVGTYTVSVQSVNTCGSSALTYLTVN
ncbi:MAG: hypothetical protein NTW49_12705, partial [Bacteroidia bacterium]|nr:hypothetical protein [Bacteroidia bacterium]